MPLDSSKDKINNTAKKRFEKIMAINFLELIKDPNDTRRKHTPCNINKNKCIPNTL